MQLTLTRPDDWHLHLRDGAMLETAVPHTARVFRRALVMPNLSPPITTVDQALAYRQRILAAVPASCHFEPLMTLYMTDTLAPNEAARASEQDGIVGIKLYPAGATTHSDAGVTRLENIYPVLEVMQDRGLPLEIHAEVTDPAVDIFDREREFIDRHLQPLMVSFPGLRIVFEHVTTEDAVRYVEQGPSTLAATITPQHLLYNRNHLLAGGIHPHNYCLPVLKRERHRQALVAAATSGNPKFFLGTDSAPHLKQRKESACGCAGCYTAPVAMELYAEVFEGRDALSRLEGFASFFGADFYGLPRNTESITLHKESQRIAEGYPVEHDRLVPFRAGEEIGWKAAGD